MSARRNRKYRRTLKLRVGKAARGVGIVLPSAGQRGDKLVGWARVPTDCRVSMVGMNAHPCILNAVVVSYHRTEPGELEPTLKAISLMRR